MYSIASLAWQNRSYDGQDNQNFSDSYTVLVQFSIIIK